MPTTLLSTIEACMQLHYTNAAAHVYSPLTVFSTRTRLFNGTSDNYMYAAARYYVKPLQIHAQEMTQEMYLGYH